MNKKNTRIGVVCFSPTNTTQKVCHAVAEGMHGKSLHWFNITLPDVRTKIITDPNLVTKDIDYLIVGSPVYSGKLPLQVIQCLNVIKGHGVKCVAIVVYGNRDFGIALSSLADILISNQFSLVSAGAFIGQHSYSAIVPVAVGRPDKADIDKARDFGVRSITSTKNLNLHHIPIQYDKISTSDTYSDIKPTSIVKRCVCCGKCSKICPTSALSPESGQYLDRSSKKICIGCMACVNICSKKAKITKANPFVKVVMKNIFRHASRVHNEPRLIFP